MPEPSTIKHAVKATLNLYRQIIVDRSGCRHRIGRIGEISSLRSSAVIGRVSCGFLSVAVFQQLENVLGQNFWVIEGRFIARHESPDSCDLVMMNNQA